MDASRFTHMSPLRSLGALAVALPFALTACAAEPPAPQITPADEASDTSPVETETSGSGSSDSGNGNTGGATFQIGDATFEFSPTLCIVGDEDVMAQGPGRNVQTGEIAFLDVDFTSYAGSFAGGADIELGTDKPFTSPDTFYRLDPHYNSEGFAITVEGRSFTAEGLFVAHGLEGTDEANPGVLSVNCTVS